MLSARGKCRPWCWRGELRRHGAALVLPRTRRHAAALALRRARRTCFPPGWPLAHACAAATVLYLGLCAGMCSTSTRPSSEHCQCLGAGLEWARRRVATWHRQLHCIGLLWAWGRCLPACRPSKCCPPALSARCDVTTVGSEFNVYDQARKGLQLSIERRWPAIDALFPEAGGRPVPLLQAIAFASNLNNTQLIKDVNRILVTLKESGELLGLPWPWHARGHAPA